MFPVLCRADYFPVLGVPISVSRGMNYTLGRHAHDFGELVLVAGGSAQHDVFAPDGNLAGRVILEQGHLFLIPLGWSHAYDAPDGVEILNVLFDDEFGREWWPTGAPFGFEGWGETWPQWMLRRSEREHLETELRVIMRELRGRQRGFQVAATTKLAQIMVWIDRLGLPSRQLLAPGAQEAVWEAVAWMEQRFADPLTLHDIARVAHLSPNYFCEVFRLATGQSPGRYLLELRLEHARFLLLTTSWPITHVARQSGFADPSYFARAFKSSFGTSPSRLRRRRVGEEAEDNPVFSEVGHTQSRLASVT